jgi:hypothetical protein
MKKIKFGIPILALIFVVNLGNTQGAGQVTIQVTIKEIGGVKHILNPEKPLKGTIILDVEKALEINPFTIEDVGIQYMLFDRDDDGSVILFDPNRAEGYKFDNKGKYLGPLVKKGQGPGEFSPGQGMYPSFVGDQIWVRGGMKLARFDRAGKLIKEITLKNRPEIIIDDSHFVSLRHERKGSNELVQTYSLIKFGLESLSDEIIADFIQAANIGMIRSKDGRGGFAEPWGTPDLKIAYGKRDQRIYAAVTSKYEITVKNLKGETLFVIEKKHQNVKVGNKDKEDLLGPRLKQYLSVYPDELLAFQEMQVLPNGYLVVLRVSGIKQLEADIFDPEGRYIYALKMPEGISMERASFHGTGFGLIDYKGDFPVYIDYRIKNLPDVFGK